MFGRFFTGGGRRLFFFAQFRVLEETRAVQTRDICIVASDDGKMKIAELEEHWFREIIGLERALASEM